MRPTDKIDPLIKNLKTSASPELDQRIANLIVQSPMKRPRILNTWSKTMKNTFKFAAAAIVLIAAFLSLTLFDKTVAPAYALEQTIQALNTMVSIHVKVYFPGYQEPVLVWTQFCEGGQTKALRVSQSRLAPGDPYDGPKEAIWKDNAAQVWYKNKNMLIKVYDQTEVAKIGALFQELNPKLLVQKLEQMQQQGTAQIEIVQPDQIDQPIIITATLTEENPLLGHHVVVRVDQTTKLVTYLETLKGDGTLAHKKGYFGMYDFNKLEFLNYNQSFDEDIFTLNVPDNVIVVDQIERAIGLEQGQMSCEEVAVQVVRRFWESIINQDYETAGLLYQGVPAGKIKENYGPSSEGRIIQVLSIGKAHPHPNPDYDKGLLVPCSIEIEKNGQIKQMDFNYLVTEVHSQPKRWTICATF